MMNRKVIYPVLALLFALAVFLINDYLETKDREVVYEQASEVKENTKVFFLPSSTTGQVIHHEGYSLSYHEDYEQAEWVAYELKKSHLKRINLKRPYFEVDNAVKTGAAHWKNYKRSGYSRGHLCPAADRKYSKAAHDETFLTSNISPQDYDFNAGVWNRLEQKVRYWADRNDGLFVVTGGVLHPGLETIGEEEVAIPEYFYKVLMDYNDGNPKILAFLMKHEDSRRPLYDFVVTTDHLEELTGIDFFPSLPDNVEDKLERSDNYKDWSF